MKKKKKLTSKELRKKARRIKKKVSCGRRSFILLICKKCKREYKIRVNDKSIYTKKIIKNWICLLCRK